VHFADVPGTRLHYRMDGTRGKPVLVLSNSLGTDLSMWQPQMDALRPHFCVLRYDARGHGQSGVPAGPYTVEQLGRDVVALLDHVQAERATFCGLSLGGLTGMWLGVHAASRIDRLVLASTSAYIGPAELWNQRIDKVNAGGMAAISDAVLARWFTPDFIARERDTLARMKAMMDRQPPAGYVACCAAVRDADLRESVARIGAPTLVIAGAHDVATPPAQGAWVAQQIAGAQLVELAASHLSNIEAKDGFNAALAVFLGTER
jgi:3-oxoadipate enol-lactonase